MGTMRRTCGDGRTDTAGAGAPLQQLRWKISALTVAAHS
jgi:hypothetical protein